MTPTPVASTPWWQTIVVTLVNIAAGALVNHYLGPAAGAGTMGAGTAVAHVMQSPRKR